MAGWSEKILDIDLNTQTYKTYPLDMEMAHLFIGGRGLGARLLWDMVGPEVDPLSPENVLIFTNGPLTATGYQTSNRFSVTTKKRLLVWYPVAVSGPFVKIKTFSGDNGSTSGPTISHNKRAPNPRP